MTPPVSDKSCLVVAKSTQDPTEELLVVAAKSGDRRAFSTLCARHSNRIVRKIYRITKNWQDAEDALQDSFLKAFVHLNQFEGRSTFSSWLNRIAINSALVMLRKRVQEIPIDYANDESGNWGVWEWPDHAESPESSCVRREREELLRIAVLQLPSVFRDVVQLKHAQDCSTNEIAKALGITIPAAKSRLSRAKKTLRASLLSRDAISGRHAQFGPNSQNRHFRNFAPSQSIKNGDRGPSGMHANAMRASQLLDGGECN